MATIAVTEELRNIIRNFRKEQKIVGTVLSKQLKKNTSFISELENGKIDEIELQLFYTILENIFPDEVTRTEQINDMLERLSIKLSEEEIEDEIWIRKFDYQYRLIMITDGLLNFLREKIDLLKDKYIISANDIIKRLNSNEDIQEPSQYEDNDLDIKFNDEVWIHTMKFNQSENYLEEILEGKIVKTSYFIMFGIIVSILRYLDIESVEAKKTAKQIMFKNKFYTLQEKHLSRNDKDKINKYDEEYLLLSQKLTSFLNFMSDKDTGYINERLKVTIDNLTNEPSLTLAILGVELSKLNTLKSDMKKAFIEEYRKLVIKYIDISSVPIIEKFD